MGKIADAIRGCALPQQKTTKLLTLDREFEQMESKINVLEAKNLKLQAQVNPLQREIDRLKEQIKQETARDTLEFDDRTGTYTGGDGLRYCARCFTKDDKRSPLQNGLHGWACPVCGKHYFDPSRPLPTVVTRRVRSNRI